MPGRQRTRKSRPKRLPCQPDGSAPAGAGKRWTNGPGLLRAAQERVEPECTRVPVICLYQVVNERHRNDRDENRYGKYHHRQLEPAREALRAVSGFLENRHHHYLIFNSSERIVIRIVTRLSPPGGLDPCGIGTQTKKTAIKSELRCV